MRYFISYCEFEKPFFAYDDTCLIMGDFGQEMANKKNDFLSSSDNSYVNFISTYPLSDYSKFVFIIECLKRNILCYSYKLVLDKKEYEFNYYNKILKFLPLIFFIFAFVKEVIYK